MNRATKSRSALAMPACVMLTLALAMPACWSHAEAIPEACSSTQLNKHIQNRSRQPLEQRLRSEALAEGLACTNIEEYPLIAAAAAYELALFHAGESNASSPEWQRAISYARRSEQLLRPTPERKLWFRTSLAVARLQMYGATTIEALHAARSDVESLASELKGVSWKAAVEDEYFGLLVELNELLVQRGDAEARAPGIAAIERYLDTAGGRADTEQRASTFALKGRLLATPKRVDGTHRDNDLEHAVVAFNQAVKLYRTLGKRDERLRTQINLALAYIGSEGMRYGTNIEQAIAILRPALKELNPQRDRDAYVGAANNLGSAYMARQSGERNQNMLEAVRWFRQARDLLDSKSGDEEEQALWTRSSVNLAMALESTKVNAELHLGEADAILTETIASLESRQLFEQTVKPLATQVAIRLIWASWGHTKQLDAAAILLDKAEKRSGQLPLALRARLQADRGDLLRQRYAAGEATALDEAIAAYRAAIELTDIQTSPTVWASMKNNLGNACNTRARPDLYQCSIDAYHQALVVRTEAAMPREHADTLVNLANLEFEHAHWPQAAQLYSTLARRHGSMFETIEQRQVLLASAGQSKRWFERAAYALARQNRVEEALWIAEQGKTRVLKRRLGLKDETGGVEEHQWLNRIQAARGTLILLPIVSTKGSMVFALFRSTHGWILRTVFLDGLDANEVVTFIQGGPQAGVGTAGWLDAYQGMLHQAPPESARSTWIAKLRESQTWMGTRLVQPVLAALRAEGIVPSTIAWVTQGELAILPLHAALLADGRALLEHMPVVYAPSLLLLRSGASAPSRGQSKHFKLVSVGNPTSDPKLPMSEVEARSTFSRVQASRARLLIQRDATAASLKQVLRRTAMFHFAGHASFNREDPQQSRLLLANGQNLTVAELQSSVGKLGPDLVILSACESGLIQIVDIANEFQGLPAAFLGLGTRGIVSSLWPVADGPTLFLMDRLMERILVHKMPVPEALRETQLWLSTARSEELANAARRLAELTHDEAAKARLDRLIWLFDNKPGWQPYADPSSWAGFFYSGRDLHAKGIQ